MVLKYQINQKCLLIETGIPGLYFCLASLYNPRIHQVKLRIHIGTIPSQSTQIIELTGKQKVPN